MALQFLLREFLRRVEESVAADGDPFALSVVFSTLRFDETSERVSIRFGGNIKSHQSASSWHILVSRRRLTVAHLSDHGSSAAASFEVVIPVVALRSTAAASLYQGLFRSPEARDFNMAESEAYRSSSIPLRCFVVECDAVSSNDVLVRKRHNDLPGDVLVAHKHCCNHQACARPCCSGASCSS